MNKLVDAVALSKSMCPRPIEAELRYAMRRNFLGRVVDGYSSDVTDICLLAPHAAEALCRVQTQLLNEHGYRVLVHDAYRPLRAVKDFQMWAAAPPADEYELERKALHYPNLTKLDIHTKGYLASNVSPHCYGTTVDLVLVDAETGELLEMGVRFDYFGERSHTTATVEQIGEVAFENRRVLADAMAQHQFNPFTKEYWHFEFAERENPEPLDLPIDRSFA